MNVNVQIAQFIVGAKLRQIFNSLITINVVSQDILGTVVIDYYCS